MDKEKLKELHDKLYAKLDIYTEVAKNYITQAKAGFPIYDTSEWDRCEEEVYGVLQNLKERIEE